MKQYKDLTQQEKNSFNKIKDILTDCPNSTLNILEVLNNVFYKADYRNAYSILIEYFDSVADEQKEQLDKDLKECGL